MSNLPAWYWLMLIAVSVYTVIDNVLAERRETRESDHGCSR